MRILNIVLCWMLAAPWFPAHAQGLTLLGAGGAGGGGGGTLTFDTKFEKGSNAQASPFSYASGSGTVAGSIGSNSNRCVVFVVGSSATLTSPAVTWNGVSATSIGSSTVGGSYSVYLFGLVNPASGSQTVSLSWSGGTTPTIVLGGISVYNANQSTCWQNFTSNTGLASTTATVTVTSTSGHIVVGGRADANATSATITSGTQDYDERCCNGNYGAGHLVASGSTGAITWTLGSAQDWAMAGVDLQP